MKTGYTFSVKDYLKYIPISLLSVVLVTNVCDARKMELSVDKSFYIDTESIVGESDFENNIFFEDDFVYLKTYRPLYLLSSKDLILQSPAQVKRSYSQPIPKVYNISFSGQTTSYASSSASVVAVEPPKKTMEQLLTLVADYASGNDYRSANATYEKIVQNHPKRFEVYYAYGLSLYKTKDYYKSIYALNQCIEMNADYALAHYALGNVYLDMKQYSAALKSYATASKINPYSADTYAMLSLTLDKMGKTELSAYYMAKSQELG